MKLYGKSYWVYTVKDSIGYLFSLCYFCFKCLRLTKPKVQLEVLMILTLNGLFHKNFEAFYFTSENFISLTLLPPPRPLLFVFFHYSVCTVISDCNHPFDTSNFTHIVSQEYIIAIENTYLNGVFLKSKISIFP